MESFTERHFQFPPETPFLITPSLPSLTKGTSYPPEAACAQHLESSGRKQAQESGGTRGGRASPTAFAAPAPPHNRAAPLGRSPSRSRSCSLRRWQPSGTTPRGGAGRPAPHDRHFLGRPRAGPPPVPAPEPSNGSRPAHGAVTSAAELLLLLLLLLFLLLLSAPPPGCRSLARRPSSGYSSSSRAASSPSAGASSPWCSISVLKEVQILECLSQLSGVYFGDENCGGPVLDAADGQSVRRDVHSRG